MIRWKIVAEKVQTGADNVTHHYYEVQAKNPSLVIKRILDSSGHLRDCFFVAPRPETKEIAENFL
ncbi:MAG: hypothetical protein IPN60_12225 [Saprospiraceae bacterium]|nr:hypothetical protein [Candidatus Opimibacter skivensis]